MDAKDFLSKVVPSDGVYYVSSVNSNQPFKEIALSSLEDVEKYIEAAKLEHKDVYFATSAYKDKKSRAASNIKSKKSIYLDLDCGENKPFKSKKEALVGLVTFCKSVNMPPPNLIVDSGGGIHVYWVLDSAITVDEWLPLAIGLKEACVNNSFQADHAITGDSARIMRIPGTDNYKTGVGRPCKVLKEYGESTPIAVLREALKAAPTLSVVPTGLGGVDNDDLGGGITLTNKRFYAKHIVEDCPTMQHILFTGGEDCTEPLWKQTLNLLAYCVDGADYIHKVSDRHPDYSLAKTENKFSKSVESAATGKYGPTTCNTFAINPTSKCNSCPHSGQIKSPISLGSPPAEELPFGWFLSDKGVWRVPVGSEESETPIQVTPYKIEEFAVKKSVADEGFVLEFIATIGKGETLRVALPQVALNDKRTTANATSRNGMILKNKEIGEFILLMNTWAQQMQAARNVGKPVNNYGWVDIGGKTGFSASNKIYWEDGSEDIASMSENILSHQYQATGTLEPWKKAADYIIKQGRPQLLCALASGFAAPIIQMTGITGVILSIVSRQSGTGKSSALKTAQSIWGCPVRGINALNDTPNSVIKRLGALKNLPAYWDELRMQSEVDEFIKLAFIITQGKEKSRLTQTAGMQEMGTWNTLVTAASNESLYDHMLSAVSNSNAGLVRIFELTFPESEYKHDIANTLMMFKDLDNNYGNAGAVYAKYLAMNRDKISTALNRLVVKLTEELHASADERFWINTIASLVVGASVANACGLTNFDVKEMQKYLVYEFARMRKDTSEDIDHSHVTNDLINDFLNAHGSQIYSVKKVPIARRGDTTAIMLPDRFPVVAMMDQTGHVRIDYKAFKAWARKKNLWSNDVLKRILAAGAKKQRRSLTSGLHIDVSQTTAYIIDISPEVMEKLRS